MKGFGNQCPYELMRQALSRRSECAAQFLFPHWCRLPFSRMHRESFSRYDALASEFSEGRAGKRFALAAPRGHAKSTIHSTIIPLLDICYLRERFIIILSATAAQAELRLRAIRRELRLNAVLREMFPHAAGLTECNNHTLVADSIRVSAFGAGSELRGIAHGSLRPTKIILDDVEESERIHSARYREELLEWYREVVEPLGDQFTHIEIVGTILHEESLLARLAAAPHFTARLYRAVEKWSPREDMWNEWEYRYTNPVDVDSQARAEEYFLRHRQAMLAGTEVLWEEKESYLDLMKQRVAMGRSAFLKEKQNEPTATQAGVFDPNRWGYFKLTLQGVIVKELTGENAHLGVSDDAYSANFSGGGAGTGTDAPGSPPAGAANQIIVPACDPDIRCEGRGNSMSRSGQKIPGRKKILEFVPGGGEDEIGDSHANARVPIASLSIVGFLDPSLGKGDWAAIATVGRGTDDTLYVLDVWVGRVPPAAQVNRVYELHERWHYGVFGYEAIGFQSVLGDAFARDRWGKNVGQSLCRLELRPVVTREPKNARIAALEPLIASGRLLFARGLCEELFVEARGFPTGKYDDALDALAGAVALAREATPSPAVLAVTVLPRRLL